MKRFQRNLITQMMEHAPSNPKDCLYNFFFYGNIFNCLCQTFVKEDLVNDKCTLESNMRNRIVKLVRYNFKKLQFKLPENIDRLCYPVCDEVGEKSYDSLSAIPSGEDEVVVEILKKREQSSGGEKSLLWVTVVLLRIYQVWCNLFHSDSVKHRYSIALISECVECLKCFLQSYTKGCCDGYEFLKIDDTKDWDIGKPCENAIKYQYDGECFRDFYSRRVFHSVYSWWSTVIYKYEELGDVQDAIRAVKYDLPMLKEIANKKNVIALANIGKIYELGIGVNQDLSYALRCYRFAAVRGYARAQTYLGIMYMHGRGVNVNLTAARFWLSKAKQNGFLKANGYLNELMNIEAGKCGDLYDR